MYSYKNSTEIAHAWIKAVNSGNVSSILELYSQDAILMPTFSPHNLRTSEARARYFELLSSRKGFSVSLHEKTLAVQNVAPGIETVTGIYRFHLDLDDEPLVFEARFSLTVDLNRSGPILHHHSSQIPRTLS